MSPGERIFFHEHEDLWTSRSLESWRGGSVHKWIITRNCGKILGPFLHLSSASRRKNKSDTLINSWQHITYLVGTAPVLMCCTQTAVITEAFPSPLSSMTFYVRAMENVVSGKSHGFHKRASWILHWHALLDQGRIVWDDWWWTRHSESPQPVVLLEGHPERSSLPPSVRSESLYDSACHTCQHGVGRLTN